MPDSGKRKVNTAIYGTDRFDHEPSPVRSAARRLARSAIDGLTFCVQEDKAEQLVSALREHVGECNPRPCCRWRRGSPLRAAAARASWAAQAPLLRPLARRHFSNCPVSWAHKVVPRALR